MTTITFTAEQEAVIAYGKGSKRNLLVSALAGSAKTTTLVALARALPLEPTLSVAFNKKISLEMAARMPSHIDCRTLNSIGAGVWTKRLGRRAVLNKDKMYDLIKLQSDKYDGSDKAFITDNFGAFLRTARMAKAFGYIPNGIYKNLGKALMEEEFFDAIAPHLDFEPDGFFMKVINDVVNISIAKSYEGEIDFDDQLYMPTLFGGEFPKYPIVLVDEAQDLSPLNHEMLTKLVGKRLIAVGDQNQAIYGFRGAHASSMEAMREQFDMDELTLSTSFRCPIQVVKKAQRLVPHMNWWEHAIEGFVDHRDYWTSDDIPEGSAIICRTNAPLFAMGMKMIKKGRGVKIHGNELGPAIIKQMKKLGELNMTQTAVLNAIDDWEKEQLEGARESRRAVIHDRADCFRVFCADTNTLAEAIAFAEHIFAAGGNVNLMTGHKSKGLEFDTVFHLDPWRLPSKYARIAAESGDFTQLQQERNLQYVIVTRSKKEYFEVNLEDFR
jgi:hypothetical protein